MKKIRICQRQLEEFGVELKRRREDKGLSQEDVSGLTGISVSHISNIERGKTNAGLDNVFRLANSLGIEIKFSPVNQ